MDASFEVLTTDGWTKRQFQDVECVKVSAGPGPEGLELSLIGERSDRKNQIEDGILDAAPKDRSNLANSIPKDDSGESIPVTHKDNPSLSDLSEMLDGLV